MALDSLTFMIQMSKVLFYLPDISYGEEKIPISVSDVQL